MRVRLRQHAAWVAVPLVALITQSFPAHQLTSLLTLLLLGLFAVFCSRHPEGSLIALLTFLPFHVTSESWLHALGLTTEIARPLGNWKDAVVAGLVLAAGRELANGRRRLDGLDKLALAFVALVLAYLFVLPGVLFPDPGSAGTHEQLLRFREWAAMLLLFVGARHAPLRPVAVKRAATGIQVAAVVVCVCAVVEFVVPDAWNTFAVEIIQYPRYLLEVLRLDRAVVFAVGGENVVVRTEVVAGREITRVGSVFFAPITLGFYLLLPFALSLARIATERANRQAHTIAALIGFSLVFTFTRSALVGALTIGAAGIWIAAPGSARARYAIVALLGLIVLVPFGADAGLSDRNAESIAEERVSNPEGHLAALQAGFDDLVANPLGTGAGTARFGGDQAYLQIGNELGVAALVLFVLILVNTLRALHRTTQRRNGPAGSSGTWAGAALIGGIGVTATSLFILAWNVITIAWLFWGFAGAVLGVTSRERADRLTDVKPSLL